MKNGPYELVKAPAEYPGKRYRDRYVYEHHLVWWQHTGQLVPEGFVLHHKDEKKRHNVYPNLELKTVGDHSREHGRSRTVWMRVCCGWCGEFFMLTHRLTKMRLKQSKSGKLYCCRSHQVKDQHSPVAQG